MTIVVVQIDDNFMLLLASYWIKQHCAGGGFVFCSRQRRRRVMHCKMHVFGNPKLHASCVVYAFGHQWRRHSPEYSIQLDLDGCIDH